ncbi:MAG: hypothetical protein ACR2LM_17475 [Pyrinomonadaceae bacterium]
METSTIYIIGAAVLLAIFVLIARLAVRWIVRLTMIGIIIVALIGGALFWWWTRSLADKPQNRARPSPTRRAATR